MWISEKNVVDDVILNDSFHMTHILQKRKPASYWLINSVPFYFLMKQDNLTSVPSTINAFDNPFRRFTQISPDYPAPIKVLHWTKTQKCFDCFSFLCCVVLN